MQRFLGCKPDPRDRVEPMFAAHRAAAGMILENASVDTLTLATKDQKRSNSCTGNATMQADRDWYLARGLECPELSARANYREALNLDGTAGDEGSHLSSTLQALQLHGATPESVFPFDEAAILEPVPYSALRAGFDMGGQRSHHRVADGSWTEMQLALSAKLPVVGGWPVSESFCQSSGREIFGLQQGAMAGFHAMEVVAYGTSEYFEMLLRAYGYRADAFIPELAMFKGSWFSGGAYGFYGRILVRRDFFEDAQDVWALDNTKAVST